MIPTSSLPLVAALALCSSWSLLSARASTLLDLVGDPLQYDLTSPTALQLNQVVTDFPTSTTMVFENFQLSEPYAGPLTLSALFRADAGYDQLAAVQQFSVILLEDLVDAEAELQSLNPGTTVDRADGVTTTELIDPSGLFEYGLVELELDVDLQNPGEYWVGFAPIAASAQSGVFRILGADPQPVEPGDAGVVNPGNLLGTGVTTVPGDHFAYAVETIPEPSAPLLVVSSFALALLRRRRAEPSRSSAERIE